MKEQIAKAIMKEVKSKDTKTGKISIILLANQSECRTYTMYYFSAELKAKQETIQSKKVEDALKRSRAVLDAETQKILHSFLQGEYCLSFGFSLTHVGIVLKDSFRIGRFSSRSSSAHST